MRLFCQIEICFRQNYITSMVDPFLANRIEVVNMYLAEQNNL